MSTATLLDDMIMHTKKYYLKQHGSERITRGSDGRYKTRLRYPDGTRKLVARNKLEDIENIIVEFYKDLEQSHSMEALFQEYMMDRRKYVRTATINREHVTFNRFLKDTSIAQKEMKDISIKELSDFCEESIITHRLNKKSYGALKSLLNGIFDFALENGYVSVNTSRAMRSLGRSFFTQNGGFNEMEISGKYGTEMPEDYEEEKVQKDAPQYYSIHEQEELVRTCLEIFQEGHNTAYLAIIMNFCLGLRIGELVALKRSDFDLEKMEVSIRRREVTNWNITTGQRVPVVSLTLKNESSYRTLPVTPACRKIYEMIVSDTRKRGLDSEYLFLSVKNGDRMHSVSVDTALDKANRRAGLAQRSIHKIRKTFLSKLDMSRLFTLEKIRSIAGHSRDSLVLYTHYFNYIEDAEGIRDCTDFSEVVDYGMPDELAGRRAKCPGKAEEGGSIMQFPLILQGFPEACNRV